MRNTVLGLFCLMFLITTACSEGEPPPAGDGPAVKEDGKLPDKGPPVDVGQDKPPKDASAEQAADITADTASDQAAPDLPVPDLQLPDTGPPPPDKCLNAKMLKLVNGKVTENGDTSVLTDEFAKLTCGGSVVLDGPQAYYMILLAGGESYKITLSPQFDGYFYLFSPMAVCTEASIQKDCSSQGSSGDFSPLIGKGGSKSLTFKPAKTGYWYVTVDSSGAANAGKFVLKVELDCQKFDDKCNNGINDKGVCKPQPKTGTCNDEDPCTLNDTCVNSSGLGICQGTAKVCAGNACNTGKCDKTSGLCVNVPKAGIVNCDDSDPCTLNDQCQAGVCKGKSMNCSSVSDTCNLGLCIKGSCTKVPRSGTISCDDKDACTDNDACANGVCAGKVKNCVGGQCNNGGCAVIAGKATCVKVYKAGYCNDGDPCTISDTCQNVSGAGVCKGTAKTCPTDACNSGTCDSKSGLCKKVLKSGTCDDSDKCTESDKCVAGLGGAGTCKGTAKACGGDQCNNGKCDKTSGKCQKAYKAGYCSDGNLCTTGDKCVSVSGLGVCKGKATTCGGDQCNTAVCDKATGKCKKVFKAGSCNDGNLCTASDKCVVGLGGAGICRGTVVTCAGDQCNNGVCDKATGKCKKAFKTGSCNDGDLCTVSDKCQIIIGGAGVCKGAAKTCAGDQCNSGKCNKSNGACYKAYKSGVCTDGNLCTLADTCANVGGLGVCKGKQKTCLKNQCNTGLCNTSTGQCIPKTGGCEDGNKCTQSDTCKNGVCIPGTQKSCSAKQCYTAKCSAYSGACVYTPYSGGSCNDSNSCTVNDTCLLGSCKGSYTKDGYETNNICAQRKYLGGVNEDAGWISKSATISPPTDVDWFYGNGYEKAHVCFPWTSQAYYFKVRVYVPSGRTFRACVGNNTCNVSCKTGSGTISLQYTRKGQCAYTDNTTGIMSVQAVDGKTGCQSYTISFSYN